MKASTHLKRWSNSQPTNWITGRLTDRVDGQRCYCAAGYLARKAGMTVGELEAAEDYAERLFYRSLLDRFGMTEDNVYAITSANDFGGLQAAIEELEAIGK